MTQKKTLFQKAGKALGTVGNVLAIFDAVAMVDKVTGHAAPLVDKAIDRHYDSQKDLISLQDLTDLDRELASQHLTAMGLVVVELIAKPKKAYAHHQLGQVVQMVPRQGKLRKGSMVKLYYLDEKSLAQSQKLLADEQKRQQELKDRLKKQVTEAKKALNKLPKNKS